MFLKNPRGLLPVLLLVIPCFLHAEGFMESPPLDSINRYILQNGIVMPPDEAIIDTYIGSYDYGYPEPESNVGINLYNTITEIDGGRDGLLQLGIQGKIRGFQEMPPLNLVLAIDTSAVMDAAVKKTWIAESMESLLKKIRDIDSLALVVFNDNAQLLFAPTPMNSALKRRQFLDAVNNISFRGRSNVEAGIALAYEQASINFQDNSINQVLYISDMPEFSSHLSQANAHSGDIRVTLLWDNRNDLDLHIVTPNNEEIYFDHKTDSTGGWLEGDRNERGETVEPIETILWPQDKAVNGTYKVYVQNYDFHEEKYTPTDFQIEIKNGNEYTYYEGTVRGTGRTSRTEVCSFDYYVDETVALIYRMIEVRRLQGIAISSLETKGNFDRVLMQALAEHEWYSAGPVLSDTFKNPEKVEREFDQLEFLASKGLEIELEFTPGITLLEVVGYESKIDRNKVFITLPSLRQGDSRTLLVYYRIPDNTPGRLFAVFRIKNQDEKFPVSADQIVVLSEQQDDTAKRMTIYSGTMKKFAEGLKRIGDYYYNTDDELEGLEKALELTGAIQKELEKSGADLKHGNAFIPEKAILERYTGIFTQWIADNQFAAREKALTQRDADERKAMFMALNLRLNSRMRYGDWPLSRMTTRDGSSSGMSLKEEAVSRPYSGGATSRMSGRSSAGNSGNADSGPTSRMSR
jgi:Ca-activated chloride channel family protein